jgi:hypothetical protein
MDQQLAAALATEGFRRPIDVTEDYYAKGQPDSSEDYFVRVLTREESLSMLQADKPVGEGGCGMVDDRRGWHVGG